MGRLPHGNFLFLVVISCLQQYALLPSHKEQVLRFSWKSTMASSNAVVPTLTKSRSVMMQFAFDQQARPAACKGDGGCQES